MKLETLLFFYTVNIDLVTGNKSFEMSTVFKAGRYAFQMRELDVERKKDTVTTANLKEDEMSSLCTPFASFLFVSIIWQVYHLSISLHTYLPAINHHLQSSIHHIYIYPSVHPLSIYQLSPINCHLTYVFYHSPIFLSIKHLVSILYLKKWHIYPIKEIVKPNLNVLKYVSHWMHIGDMRIFNIRTIIGVNPTLCNLQQTNKNSLSWTSIHGKRYIWKEACSTC